MRFLCLLLTFTTAPYVVHANALNSLLNTLIGEPTPRVLAPAVAISPAVPLSLTAEQPSNEPLKNPASIILLDKRTNDLTPLTLTTTAPRTVRELTFSVKNCLRHHPKVGQHSMWITVKETLTENTEETPPLYEGWMYSAFPEATALDHPRYNIRLITCTR